MDQSIKISERKILGSDSGKWVYSITVDNCAIEVKLDELDAGVLKLMEEFLHSKPTDEIVSMVELMCDYHEEYCRVTYHSDKLYIAFRFKAFMDIENLCLRIRVLRNNILRVLA